MKRVRYAVLVLLAVVVLLALLPACAQPAASPAPSPKPSPSPTASPAPAPKPSPSPTPTAAAKKIHWDVALVGSPRALTYPIDDWAKEMGKLTNGLWDITLQYGEVLAKGADMVDGIKAGSFEAAMPTAMHTPGKVPLHTVIELPFLGPSTVTQIGAWIWEVYRHPAIVKEANSWNAMMLFPIALPQYELMSIKPVRKVEDLKGLRMKVAVDMGAPMDKYGIVKFNMSFGEAATALTSGMIDSAAGPWAYVFGSYAMHEKLKYATINISMGAAGMQVLVNKKAWEALPEEWRKYATTWAETKSLDLYQKYNDEADVKWIDTYKKAGVEIIKFPPEERAKLLEQAEPLWEAWVKRLEGQGQPAREVLNFAKTKLAEVVKKYPAK